MPRAGGRTWGETFGNGPRFEAALTSRLGNVPRAEALLHARRPLPGAARLQTFRLTCPGALSIRAVWGPPVQGTGDLSQRGPTHALNPRVISFMLPSRAAFARHRTACYPQSVSFPRPPCWLRPTFLPLTLELRCWRKSFPLSRSNGKVCDEHCLLVGSGSTPRGDCFPHRTALRAAEGWAEAHTPRRQSGLTSSPTPHPVSPGKGPPPVPHL